MASYPVSVTNGAKKVGLHPYGPTVIEPGQVLSFDAAVAHPLYVHLLSSLVTAGIMTLTSGSFPTDIAARVASFESRDPRSLEEREQVNVLLASIGQPPIAVP